MSYLSPFSTRYGSKEMRALWSELAKRRTWRRVWVAVAQAQAAAGLVTAIQVDELRAHAGDVDLERALEIENEIGHDLMAELRTFAEQCPAGGSILHWGLTSADVQDNAEIVRQKASLSLLLERLRAILLLFAERIEESHSMPLMGFTHLQPAEPTTLGYRLSIYAHELLDHFDSLARLHGRLRGKGIRGPVGTSATFVDMLAGSEVTPEMLEATVMEALGIEAYPVSTQTYPRVQDYTLLTHLSGLAASLHKFALDLRLMQSPGFGGAQEPFGRTQVGSSAMPFKRNPVTAEKICSLARLVNAHTAVAWENAAGSALERTLDDSANRRSIIPESFLAVDEMLLAAGLILRDLRHEPNPAQDPLVVFGPFAATERILTAAVKAGADRVAMHERLREHSMHAWEQIQEGQPNPLIDALAQDTFILGYLQPGKIRELMDAENYIGLAPERALETVRRLRTRFVQDETA
ncbi:MAG: adenylosuccinate lyase [Anaerolineales bacterium]